jgi:signal transduction histidine kinase
MERVELVRQIGRNLRVCVTPGYITQIVLNLVANSVDAVVGVKRPRIAVRADLVDRGVQVVIEDNGPGIAPDVLPRIFEPFFTTKPAGAGTGLGLSVCYGLARRMGGSLAVRSLPGEGTAFSLFIPAEAMSPDAEFCRSRSQGLESKAR